LQILHISVAFSARSCPALHRIACPVVSEWCQKVEVEVVQERLGIET
jgi:hypothetical protein